MLDAKVIPLLFKLELSDLSGPLSQFQAQKVEESGLMEIVKAINKVADGQTSEQIVNRLVPQLWPSLQADLEKIPDTQPSDKHMRPQHEILEELVTGVRGLNTRMRDFDPELAERERLYRRKRTRLHPRMFEEMAFVGGEIDDAPVSLLLMAGYLRDDYPWLAELLTESYREIRNGSPNEAERVLTRLRRSVKHLSRGSMMRDMVGNSKEAMFMLDELPMFLEMTLHRIADLSGQEKAVENKAEE